MGIKVEVIGSSIYSILDDAAFKEYYKRDYFARDKNDIEEEVNASNDLAAEFAEKHRYVFLEENKFYYDTISTECIENARKTNDYDPIYNPPVNGARSRVHNCMERNRLPFLISKRHAPVCGMVAEIEDRFNDNFAVVCFDYDSDLAANDNHLNLHFGEGGFWAQLIYQQPSMLKPENLLLLGVRATFDQYKYQQKALAEGVRMPMPKTEFESNYQEEISKFASDLKDRGISNYMISIDIDVIKFNDSVLTLDQLNNLIIKVRENMREAGIRFVGLHYCWTVAKWSDLEGDLEAIGKSIDL